MTVTGASASNQGASSDDWPDLALLTRHIVETHHQYVRASIPRISACLEALAQDVDMRGPELPRVRTTFSALGLELLAHMTKEEQILFPYIDELARAKHDQNRPPSSPFGTIANPVRMMEDDHVAALELMEQIRNLTHRYTRLEGATATGQQCLSLLAAFDADLRVHTNIENSVLFPRALDLENELA